MANLSFSKVTTVGSTGLVPGRIYFETSTGLIKVATSATATNIFGGVRSASYIEETKILTIINQTGETITLDLSDVASADSVTAELNKKLNVGSSSDASTVKSYYGLKKYVDEQIDGIPAAVVYKSDGSTITQSGTGTVTFSVGTIAQSKVSGLTSALAGKAAASHTHTKAQITDFNESDYATAAQGTKADTALQSITAAGSGNLKLSVAAKSGTSQAISGSLTTSTITSGGSGLVTASDAKSYIASQINAAQVSALKYKGSCTYAELPESPAQGDVWNVTDKHGNVPAGTNYAWDGEAWDPLAGAVDLSPYLLSSTAASTYITPSAVDTKITTAINGLDKADVAAANQFVTAVSEANGIITVTRARPTITNIDGLQDALGDKANVNHTHTGTQVTLTGYTKPSSGSAIDAGDSVNAAIGKLEASLGSKVDTNTTYTFANGTDGSFTVTPSAGSAQKVTIGKPATAGTADNATTANKVAQSLVVKLNEGTAEGTSQFTFNGSAAKTVNITAASVGAAAASHTHSNYVPTTRTVNGKALSNNITLTAADVNADPEGSADDALASAKSYADGLWVWTEFE